MALTNQTVQSKRLGKNEDQNHANEQLGLLCVRPALATANKDVQMGHKELIDNQCASSCCSPDTRVAHDADGHASCETRQATSQARGQVREAVKQLVCSGVNCIAQAS